MTKKSTQMKKMLFDLIMTILLVFLMDTFTTGLMLHEILGLLLGVFFIIHKLLHYKWIKSVALRLFDPTVKKKAKFLFAVDFLLLVGVTVILVTGIGISRELFGLADSNHALALWVALHHCAAYGSLILISVHIGLHWSSILSAAKKAFGMVQHSRARAVIARVAAVCIMLAGVKASIQRDVAGNLTEPFAVGRDDTQTSTTVITGYTEAVKQTSTATITKTAVTAQPAAAETLQEYLSKLICTGCSKRCPLSRPLCGKGETRAAAATTEYYQKNNSSTGSSSSSQADSAGSGSTGSSSSAKADSSSSGSTGNSASSQSGTAGSSSAQSDSSTASAAAAGSASTQNPLSPLADFIPIMGLFIGGAHYSMLLPKKLLNLLFE